MLYLVLLPVCSTTPCHSQGGFHELQNEPDGVKEKLVEQIVNFVEETVPTAQVSGGGGSDASVPKASL
jgi:acylglycerol lipase